MKFFKIEYRLYSWEGTGVIVVSADNPAEAIKKAGLQDAYECNIRKYVPYRVGNKLYTRRYGTYNSVWLDNKGNLAYWGSYNPDDASYYLCYGGTVIASGTWASCGEGSWEFKALGSYSYDEVRRALQLGVLVLK
ncbi:MAG: hypothetical protein U0L26_00955 [Cellulosilyticum sp.]|nr:hypothetical protein [Cellulosilyticum sp.]